MVSHGHQNTESRMARAQTCPSQTSLRGARHTLKFLAPEPNVGQLFYQLVVLSIYDTVVIKGYYVTGTSCCVGHGHTIKFLAPEPNVGQLFYQLVVPSIYDTVI